MNLCKAIISCLLVLPLVGCANTGYTNPNLGRNSTRSVISQSIHAMGGQARLTDSTYRLRATVTQYSAEGSPSVSQVRMRIDPGAQVISASAPTGTGYWRANIQDEECTFVARGYKASPQSRKATCETLQTVLHRVTGPMNFYLTGEKAHTLTRTLVDGVDVLRVGVSNGQAQAKAYYFDAKTGLLRFVTVAGDIPGKGGTVTIYKWQTLHEGTVFPKSIRVVNLGQHVLVGLMPTLEVEFMDVQVLK